jgi:hypothetical protein
MQDAALATAPPSRFGRLANGVRAIFRVAIDVALP